MRVATDRSASVETKVESGSIDGELWDRIESKKGVSFEAHTPVLFCTICFEKLYNLFWRLYDAQMEELNPLIRDAIYTAMVNKCLKTIILIIVN